MGKSVRDDGTGLRRAGTGRLRRATAVVVVCCLVVGVAGALAARRVAEQNEQRTFRQEATIESTAVSSLVYEVKSTIDSSVSVAEATGGNPAAFRQVAPDFFSGLVLQRRDGRAWVTDTVVGRPQVSVSEPRVAATLTQLAPGRFGLLGFFGTGSHRLLAVAEEASDRAARVIGEVALPESLSLSPRTGAVAGSLPNLSYALYAGSDESDGNVLLTNTSHLPLAGRQATVVIDLNDNSTAVQPRIGGRAETVRVGPGDVLLVTSPNGSLLGALASDFPWILLAVALLATVALGAMVEMILRRRDDALLTVAQLETQNQALDRAVAEQAKAERERTQMEAQLRAAHRLEAVGKLAGGIAHDFNNLLAVILNYASFAVEDLEGHPAQEDIKEVVGAARRAAELTQQLLVFSRQDVVEAHVIDLNTVVQGMERMLQRTLGEDLVLRTELHPALASVTADVGELEQILMNLAVNARDAMPDSGGTLIVSTDNLDLSDQDAVRHPQLAAGPYVRLRARDTGVGMTPEVLARAFEPFYTTKGPGEGTGLGLSTVYGIVTRWGGELSAVSKPGLGTEVTVLLPATSASLVETADDEAPSPATPSGEQTTLDSPPSLATILVVEDERAVRGAAVRILTGVGYQVLEAESGSEALMRDDLDEVDLLLTDVVMPGGVTGSDLAAQLRIQHPDLAVLFMSGYTADVITHHGVLDEGIVLVQKPFNRASLLEAVAAVLSKEAVR